mmetsp:Transcript_12588/g.36557  ORF Transcript_12588/g.36557 Transcript_12588/m.36557 type:complete len:209 (-) Transcript_12588:98-724(-)
MHRDESQEEAAAPSATHLHAPQLSHAARRSAIPQSPPARQGPQARQPAFVERQQRRQNRLPLGRQRGIGRGGRAEGGSTQGCMGRGGRRFGGREVRRWLHPACGGIAVIAHRWQGWLASGSGRLAQAAEDPSCRPPGGAFAPHPSGGPCASQLAPCATQRTSTIYMSGLTPMPTGAGGRRGRGRRHRQQGRTLSMLIRHGHHCIPSTI